MRAFPFPVKDTEFNTRGVLAGVLGEYLMEEDHRVKFCDLLEVMVSEMPKILEMAQRVVDESYR